MKNSRRASSKQAAEFPIDFLRECFAYDPSTGVLTWRERPRQHFKTVSAWAARNAEWAGKAAGTPTGDGYLNICLTFTGRAFNFRAHRIIWALAHGHWPTDQIDHRNGVRDDNRLANLREATRAENHHNRPKHCGSSGFLGVSWDNRESRWRSAIRVGGRTLHLGYFDTPEAAFRVYLAAKRVAHPFQPTPRGIIPPHGIGLPARLIEKLIALKRRREPAP